MPDKLTMPDDDLEELSRLLDDLNNGNKPESSGEMAELLEIASLLKAADMSVAPPQHILDQTVDRALKDIKIRKTGKLRKMIFSGALGTAAAVLLVFGLNQLPSWQQQVNLTPPVASDQQIAGENKQAINKPAATAASLPAENPGANIKSSTPSVVNGTPKEAPAIASKPEPAEKQSIPAKSEAAKTLTRAAKPEILDVPAQPAPPAGQSKSFTLLQEIMPDKAEQTANALTPITIPGKTPDLVVTDQKSSTICQTYNKGAMDEIKITQRILSSDEKASHYSLTPPSAEKARIATSGQINKVKIIIADQEITIEGRLSSAELNIIAESLKP